MSFINSLSLILYLSWSNGVIILHCKSNFKGNLFALRKINRIAKFQFPIQVHYLISETDLYFICPANIEYAVSLCMQTFASIQHFSTVYCWFYFLEYKYFVFSKKHSYSSFDGKCHFWNFIQITIRRTIIVKVVQIIALRCTKPQCG